MIGVGYGPGTRSVHITFHFITHAYEGHNLHRCSWGTVCEEEEEKKNRSVSRKKKKGRCGKKVNAHSEAAAWTLETQDDDERRERSTVNVSGGQLLADLRGTWRAQSKEKVIETGKKTNSMSKTLNVR